MVWNRIFCYGISIANLLLAAAIHWLRGLHSHAQMGFAMFAWVTLIIVSVGSLIGLVSSIVLYVRRRNCLDCAITVVLSFLVLAATLLFNV